MTSDHRMTWGLIHEVLSALERHGYHKHDNQHTGQAIGAIFDLAHIYEGTRETHPDPVTPSPHPEPAPPVPQADLGAVILTHADVSTVFAALDIAADYKRDRAETCPECPDRSCPTCQARLRDARAFDQMADSMLQAAEPVPATHQAQAEPHGLPSQPDLAADKEAGQ
jgi:hypothetical protein